MRRRKLKMNFEETIKKMKGKAVIPAVAFLILNESTCEIETTNDLNEILYPEINYELLLYIWKNSLVEPLLKDEAVSSLNSIKERSEELISQGYKYHYRWKSELEEDYELEMISRLEGLAEIIDIDEELEDPD